MVIEMQKAEFEAEMPRKEESDEENELEDDEGMDKWGIKEERDGSRNEDQNRQESGRDQLRNDGGWTREEERGKTEENENMADDEGGSLSE
jgi:hypothetical protein